MKNMPLDKVVTPENHFGFRRLAHQAPHLETIDIQYTYNIEKALTKWIDEHLKKRYYLSKNVGLTSGNKIENVMRVGFEDPKELSYFVLACPLLKYK
jgi:hypothetical protein